VLFDGEVVSLNRDLVQSSSGECWSAIRRHSAQDEEAAIHLLGLYRGRYALDFAYDDWASSYRENLHAAVLARTEAAISACWASGREDSAIRLAHDIELALLRIYKATGRHAAAAEQYAHYAAVVRDELGADPPPFDDV
jgi:two-component SAPR family response regulator